jgi:hypothetical protein
VEKVTGLRSDEALFDRVVAIVKKVQADD